MRKRFKEILGRALSILQHIDKIIIRVSNTEIISSLCIKCNKKYSFMTIEVILLFVNLKNVLKLSINKRLFSSYANFGISANRDFILQRGASGRKLPD